MYTKTLIFLLMSVAHLDAENTEMVYFPDDNGGLISTDNLVNIPPNVNLTEIRGTNLYEKFVDRIISGGVTKLTLAINKILLQRADRENVVFAPVCIAGALALVLLGSNGKTFEEIATVMGLATGVDVQMKSLQVHEQFGRMISKLENTAGFDMDQQVNFAAAIFVQNNYPIRDVYRRAAEDLYQSEILNVDFQTNPLRSQEVINEWVSKRTNGKIRDILGEAPPRDTKVIITSAMYFKASWEHPFFEGATRKRAFFTNGRKSPTNIQVEMMANGGRFPYYKDVNLNCEILGLPYKGNATTMYVVMPFNSDVQKLKELEENITPSEMEHLADSTAYTRTVMLFPKMKLESTIELKPVLQRLGVQSLFVPKEANLALLSPGENILQSTISKISVAGNTPSSAIPEEDIIIFNRFGEINNCSNIFNSKANITSCRQIVNIANKTRQVSYKKIGTKVGRRIVRIASGGNTDTVDNIRRIINKQSTDNNNNQNPGLYADKVLHKVYMDITETGTEAAASTSVSLSRDGGSVTFRVDVPFFFFIRHEETKTILFWGSVFAPTPNFLNSS